MKTIPVNDINHPALDIYARLSENEIKHINEPNLGCFVAESPMIIERALKAGYEPVSLLVEESISDSMREMLNQIFEENKDKFGDFPIYSAPIKLLEKIIGYKLTRGMLCALKRRPLPEVDDICRKARRLVVLENVMNPTNVGAIFRSAAALYIDGIILSPGCTDPLFRRASRVSMGTVFDIPWTFYPGNTTEFENNGIETIKKLGFKTAALALRDDAIEISDPRLKSEEKLALILGSEGYGMSETTITKCDYKVIIPMAEGIDSLNVAAASAVAFWELRKNQ